MHQVHLQEIKSGWVVIIKWQRKGVGYKLETVRHIHIFSVCEIFWGFCGAAASFAIYNNNFYM